MTGNSDYLQLISPKEIVRISHDEWVRHFADNRKALHTGTIFLVHGNPALRELYETKLHPRYTKKEFSYFRHNAPELHRAQLLQKALFSDIAAPNCFVDSYLRLRRTQGTGAFVGPHIDSEEELSENSINCWVSFSDLEAGETIQFLPPRWHGGREDLSGYFRAGTYLDRRNRLMPLDGLLKDAVSHAIGTCEYFVFNSGRMVHCSPFFLRYDRVTADQRIFALDTPEDANFAEITNYYALSDMNVFTGEREVADVLKSLWAKYTEQDRLPLCQFLAQQTGSFDAALDLVSKIPMRPDLFLKLDHPYEAHLQHPQIQTWLARKKHSVSLRSRLLDQKLSHDDKIRLSRELLTLPTQRPSKLYRKILPFLAGSDIAAHNPVIAKSAFYLLKLLESKPARYLPAPIKSRLFERFSFTLLKTLHPKVTHGS